MNNYIQSLIEGLQELNRAEIQKLAQACSEAETVYLCGNGHSHLNALGWGQDLTKMAGVRTHVLGANPALLTAYANDEGYEKAFSEIPFLTDKDVMIGITCSGSSPNIMLAMQRAQATGCYTALVTSSRAPWWKDLNCCIRAKGMDIRIEEDIHCAVGHMIAGLVREIKKE